MTEQLPQEVMVLEGLPRIGDVIESKYQIEHVLGVGGMGVVVAARHVQLQQRVAIKFLRDIATEDRLVIDRFLREARAAAALSSEHVARVVDVGTLPAGAPYIVMEYLSGIELGEVVRQHGPMAVGDAINAVLQASEAIAEAHAAGIIHRDLKPANLFVTQNIDGSPLIKVLDFGISKRTEFDAVLGRATLTPTGYLMGSPAYMSPEQVRSPKSVDTRTDIWALGVILYEILTGVTPFAGETVGATLAKIVAEAPVPIRSLRPDVPEGVAAVIAQCLEKNPERRVRTLGELAIKLSPFTPRESAISVERIVRVSGGDTALEIAPLAPRGPRANPAIETGPPWARSGTTSAIGPRLSRGSVILIGLAVWLGVCAAAAGVYIFSSRPGGRGEANGVASAATAIPAAPQPPAAAVPNAPVPIRPMDIAEAPSATRFDAKNRADNGFVAPDITDRSWRSAQPGKKSPARPARVAHPPVRTKNDSGDRLLERRE